MKMRRVSDAVGEGTGGETGDVRVSLCIREPNERGGKDVVV